MDRLLSLIAAFGENPGLRLLAGLVFFILLGIWFSRRFRGRGKSVFLALVLVLSLLFYASPAAQLLAFIPLAGLLIVSLRRPAPAPAAYLPAQALVEGGGLKRGLTAPEAAVILEMPLNRVLGVVILGMLRKKVLAIQSHDPLVLQVATTFEHAGEIDPEAKARLQRRAAQEEKIVLQPFESPFIEQLAAARGSPIGEVNFTVPAKSLLRHTARRVRGSNLAETRNYYRKHLGRARHDVARAGSGPGGDRTRDHFFEWLVLDPDFAEMIRDYQPDWFDTEQEAGLAPPEALVDWVERLVQELGTAIPPRGLQVKNGRGDVLAIGTTEPIGEQFFEAVLGEIR